MYAVALLLLWSIAIGADAASLLGVGSKREGSSSNIAQVSLLDATVQSLGQRLTDLEQAAARDLGKLRQETAEAVAVCERAKGSDDSAISVDALAGFVDESGLAAAINNSFQVLEAQIATSRESLGAAILSLEQEHDKFAAILRLDFEELCKASESKASALTDALEKQVYTVLAAVSKLSAETSANHTLHGLLIEASSSDLSTKIAIAEAYASVLVNDSASIQQKRSEEDSATLRRLLDEGLAIAANEAEATFLRMRESIDDAVHSMNSKHEGGREKIAELVSELTTIKSSVASFGTKQAVETALAEKLQETLRSEIGKLSEKLEKQGMQLAAVEAQAHVQDRRLSALEYILMNNKKQE